MTGDVPGFYCHHRVNAVWKRLLRLDRHITDMSIMFNFCRLQCMSIKKELRDPSRERVVLMICTKKCEHHEEIWKLGSKHRLNLITSGQSKHKVQNHPSIDPFNQPSIHQLSVCACMQGPQSYGSKAGNNPGLGTNPSQGHSNHI